ncbi:MAG: winged helix-turn-helix domain-containing protein [Thermofilaceae archaeon]
MNSGVKVIREPEVAKLLADETRRRILQLLRFAEMTPQQLAKALGKNVSSIAHHLSMLEQGGLVAVVRTEIRRNLVVRWYRATAHRFIVSYELAEGLIPGSEQYATLIEENARNAAVALTKMGAKLGENELLEAVELIRKLYLLTIEAAEKTLVKCYSEGKACPNDLLIKTLVAVNLYKKEDYRRTIERLMQFLGDLVE